MAFKEFLITLFVFVFVSNQKFVASEGADTGTINSTGVEMTDRNTLKTSEIEFDNRVAGHSGMKIDSEGNLWKPFINQTEVDFYENVAKTTDVIVQELRGIIPKYKGLKTDEDGKTYLVLENIVKDLAKPCVMDLKMGALSSQPGASEETVKRKREKYAMRAQWGFVTPGYKFHNVFNGNGELVERDKKFGEKMDPRGGIEALYEFINGKMGLASKLDELILEELHKIYLWFHYQTHYHFFNSSILIAYSAENLAKGLNPDVRVRMIDFNHAMPNPENDRTPDTNYATGLKKLMEVLENLDDLYEDPQLWKKYILSDD